MPRAANRPHRQITKPQTGADLIRGLPNYRTIANPAAPGAAIVPLVRSRGAIWLQRLEKLVAARTSGPSSARRVVLQADDELPEEATDELLICRVMVTPPERPEEEIVIPATPPISPRTIQAGRTAMTDPTRFHRIIQYPKTGQI
jgi:hypothetical protein